MEWIIFSLLAAFANVGRYTGIKLTLKRLGTVEMSIFGQVFFALWLVPFIFIPEAVNIPSGHEFYTAAWISIVCNIGIVILLTEAIRISDLSHAMPFLALTPVFSIVTAWAVLGEVPTSLGTIGIVVSVLGALSLGAKGFKDWICFGGVQVLKDRGVLIVIAAAVLYSIASTYDKNAVLASDPLTFSWYVSAFRAGIVALVYSYLYPRFHNLSVSRVIKKKNIWGILFVSGMIALATYTQTAALQTGLVAYVEAIKRTSLMMTSVVGMLFFKEEKTFFRIFGGGIMVAGAIMIAMAG